MDRAASAYRVFIHALIGAGAEAVDEWPEMMPEHREFWYRAVDQFFRNSASFEGQNIQKATKGFVIYCAGLPAERVQSESEWIAWQAVLWHLAYLHGDGADELDAAGLETLEQGWQGWGPLSLW